jgi:cyclophilin family peptidyl-prolyl cis-trans isomerase
MRLQKYLLATLLISATIGVNAQKNSSKKSKEKPMEVSQNLVDIITDYGTMRVKLYDETPKHRDNFLKLVKEGFYDSTLFHRVISGFMIQGGDPQSKNASPDAMLGNGGPGYTVPAEFNPAFIHKKGALSAARMGDQGNPLKESSGSQFYVVQGKPASEQELTMTQQRLNITYTPEQRQVYTTTGGTPFLDMNYTVFGEVISGLEVIDKIAAVQTKPGDRPVQDVKMTMKLVTGK